MIDEKRFIAQALIAFRQKRVQEKQLEMRKQGYPEQQIHLYLAGLIAGFNQACLDQYGIDLERVRNA